MTTKAELEQELDQRQDELEELKSLLNVEEEFLETDGAISQFLSGWDDEEGTITLYRAQGKGNKRNVFLFSRGVTEVTMPEVLESLRDDYGGGLFRIEGRDAEGAWIKGKIKYLEVEAPKRPLNPLREEQGAVAETGGDAITALAAVLERSNEQNRDFMRMMMDTLKASTPAAADPAATSKSILEGLVQMKELVGTPAPASSGMDIETFLRIAEFTRELGGNAGEANGWDALKTTISGLAPMLAQGMASAGAMPTLPPAAGGGAPGAAPRRLSHDDKPAPDPGTGAAAPDPAAAVDPRELQARFEAVFPLCISAAQRNLDPYVYANLVIDQLGLEAALNMICQPGQLEAMLAQAPALQQWRPWFDELVTAMLEERNQRVHDEGSQNTDDDAAHGDPAGAGGDTGDAASDGAAGEASAD